MAEALHEPVLVREVLSLFSPQPRDILLDATLGLGGHAAAFLDATAPTGRVVGIERDPQALGMAQKQLERFGDRVTLWQGNFAYFKDSFTGGGILRISAKGEYPPLFTHVLFDLGMGSHQLADEKRSFSFHSSGPLSMRYAAEHKLPASRLSSLNQLHYRLGELPDVPDVLHYLTTQELAEVFSVFGEERYAYRIASILKKQPELPRTGKELAHIIAQALPARSHHGRIHPATRTFQALRLAVNRELECLEAALPQAYAVLAPQGVLAVISFHSLEDRIVKYFMRGIARDQAASLLTKHPLRAGPEEISRNPRARSAKLRAIRHP